MKAVRIFGQNDIKLVDLATPEPRQGEVLCKVVRVGICGTDYSIYTGQASFVKNGMVKFPMTPGHEWSGIVEKTGENVTGFLPGDRVVGDTAVSCGNCYDCLMGLYNHCKKLRSVGTVNCWDGAYAQYILMPARHLFHLPDSISFENGALVEPVATALYSVDQAKVKIGDTVLVIGSGPIGIAAAKLAKLSGAAKVIIAARKDTKLKIAVDLGIDGAINTTRISLKEGAKEHFGQWGTDKVIEASGSISLLKESLELINPGGIISIVAFYEKLADQLDIDRFVFGDITLKPVTGSLGMYKPTLRLMASGMLDISSIIGKRCKLEQIPQIMAEMKDSLANTIKVMVEIK